MSKGINKFIGIGNLGRDPETKYLPSGDAVCNFSIAISESWKGKDGQKQERTEWINLVAFGKLGEICGQYLKKGSKVYVSGKLRTQKWEKDGETRYKTEVVIDEMQMLDSRADSAGQSGGPRANENGDGGHRAGNPSHQSFDDFESDLPF